MVKVKVNIDGMETIIRSIGMYDMKLKNEILQLVRDTARNVQRDGKARAPVSKKPKSRGKPGDLKRSIRPKYFDGGFSATVVPRKPKGSHRHLVEYGTGNRRTKSGANRGKMPKIPFMDPAEQSNDRPYNNNLKKLVDRDETI